MIDDSGKQGYSGLIPDIKDEGTVKDHFLYLLRHDGTNSLYHGEGGRGYPLLIGLQAAGMIDDHFFYRILQ